jgi:CubicO group peptidase (beta-lactamase class C family)
MKAPEAAGLDRDALVRLHDAFAGLVERGRLPGAQWLIHRRGTVGCFDSVGQLDPVRGGPMRSDAIFRIYSMTKPIVSVATMLLVQQGRLMLRDPVSKYLPEFTRTRVGVERAGRLELKVPNRPMTVHDLLRHTAGLTYEFLEPSAVRLLYSEAKLFARDRSSAEHCAALAQLPLMHEPGALWDYSRATDVLGRLVEVLAGQTLGDHLRAAVFEPLGMSDTGFVVPLSQHGRIAEPFAINPDNGVPVSTFDARVPAALENGGGGLFSTAADYARFLRMLLNGGSLDGRRLLGRKTVEFMTADHLGALPRSGEVLPPGHGFGLGFAVKTALGEHTEPGSVGTYGWSGAAGTAFFVDPQESMFAMIMVQAPGQLDEVRELFRQLVYVAIDD